MTPEIPRLVLKDKKALVVGIANEHSIAYGCAAAFRELGAELAITYLNEKAKPFVEPLARKLEAPIFAPLDVSTPGELEALFARISKDWGRLDILVHSIAFAPKEDLQGGLLDCSAEGFKVAMDVSCHSFVRMAKLAAPLMKDGGTLFAMSYHGAQKVVPNYNVMGPVKAALEAACRYLAYELGPRGIRVHPISPGPLKTRAASGLKRAGRHHGCRLRLRLPGDAVRAPHDRRHRIRRRWRQHHGLTWINGLLKRPAILLEAVDRNGHRSQSCIRET
jgi:enoyl-[acyl-carrier protein] reductase I